MVVFVLGWLVVCLCSCKNDGLCVQARPDEDGKSSGAVGNDDDTSMGVEEIIVTPSEVLEY